MCKKNKLFFKTWTFVFYVYYVTNNPILQAMETKSFTESPRSMGYPVNKALMFVRDPPTTPERAAIQDEDNVLVNRNMKTEYFADNPIYVTYKEKTALMLVCDPSNTSDWAAILHEDKVLVNRSTFSSIISYTFPSLTCKDLGQYICVTNTTWHIYVLVFGCPPQLCLTQDKLLKADLGQDVMFDVCVIVPEPLIRMPLKVFYKNTWLANGQCVLRLCMAMTNIKSYHFNMKITISNVSEEDYGEIKLKFGTSYSYENYTFNYSPVLIPRAMKTESFTESPRHLRYPEKTALMLVCDLPNTSDWAAILREDKVLVNRSTFSSIISYTFPSLSCNNFGQYLCVTNNTHYIKISVFGCPPQLCLPPKKLLTADLGQDVMLDVCVMIPNPIIVIPLTVSYKNTLLAIGPCVSRLCVTVTNVEFYRFNVKITISDVSEEDYGVMEFKFGTSYLYENYSVNYFPVLIPRAMKTESFTESPRYVTYKEKTALMLVCDLPNTSDWAAILREDKVLVNRSTFSSIISYTFPSLSCNNFGQYFCVTNTTHYINVSVFGCPPQLCLPHKKLLTADLGQDVMFDVCVMVPNPVTHLPLTVSYNNTLLANGQCVSRLCVRWTNVEFYRFNVKITISDVSEKDYGEMEFKFSTSYLYENYSVNYFPVLIPRVTNDKYNTGESMKYMIASIILVLFCIIGCGLLSLKKVRQSIQQLRREFVSKCLCLRHNQSGNQNEVLETDHDYFRPEQNAELFTEHPYNKDSETANPRNLYEEIQDSSENTKPLKLMDDYITVV